MQTTWTREEARNPKPRTLEQVREALTRIKSKTKDGADLTMARMMVAHGNLTDEAREFASNWKVTPSDLEARAAAIYGPDWQSPLARRIAVDARTVRRWKAGDREIPAWVAWALGVLERHPDER